MAKKTPKKEKIKVDKFDRTDGSKKCISLQFDQGRYYSNEWITEEEAEDLISKLKNILDIQHE